MSIPRCERNGCENIMCDRYSPRYGYICRECFEELLTKTDIGFAHFMSTIKTDESDGVRHRIGCYHEFVRGKETIKFKELEKVDFIVTNIGVPKVEKCVIHRADKNIIVLYIELNQRGCCVTATGSGDNNPCIVFDRYINKTSDGLTTIDFPTLKGWDISCHTIYKDYALVCFCKKQG